MPGILTFETMLVNVNVNDVEDYTALWSVYAIMCYVLCTSVVCIKIISYV